MRLDWSRVSDQLHAWVETTFTSARPVKQLEFSVLHKSHARCKRTDHSAAADHVLLEEDRMNFGNPVPVVFDKDKRLVSRRVKEALRLYFTEKVNLDQKLEVEPLWFSVL